MRTPAPAHRQLGQAMRAVRDHLGVSQTALATRMGHTRSYVAQWETAHEPPRPATWQRWLTTVAETARSKPRDPAWQATLEDLLAVAKQHYLQAQEATDQQGRAGPPGSEQAVGLPRTDWATDAIELLHQLEASDLGAGTLEAVDAAVEALCCAYSRTPSVLLRAQAGQQLAWIRTRLDGRLTLSQRRHLLVDAGWLALLLSALHFDLGDRVAATTMHQVAFQLGQQADHAEITAWSFETQAWFAVADGHHGKAIELARTGLACTQSTSASVQLAVQEARAWARRADRAEVKDALARASTALRRLSRPTHPEHHFVFDPAKLLFYQATCFARAGDAQRAEEHAREVIAQSTDATGRPRWPRRLLTARIDLGLALTQLRRPDEASAVGALALASGHLVPSNLWQAGELDAQLMGGYATVPEVGDFHERFLIARHSITAS